MRITRDLILKMSRDYVNKQANSNRNLACVYLTGSVLSDDFFIGNTTDVDLIFIHAATPTCKREVFPLTEEVHLDIAHVSQSVFSQPRQQRTNPWLGSFLCLNPVVLYDTLHWFEFTQAAVCAQFDRPEYVSQRAHPLAEEARQLWLGLYNDHDAAEIEWVFSYLKSLERSANAIAILSGSPLTERRFLLNFPERARRINRPGLASGLVDLFMDEPPSDDVWDGWLKQWTSTMQSAANNPQCPPDLNSCRRLYYERALTTLREDHPDAALWLMIRTWTRAVHSLPMNDSVIIPWQEICKALKIDKAHSEERLNAMDAYLDTVEETLDAWANQFGVS